MTPYSLGIIKVAAAGTPVSIGSTMALLVGTEVQTFAITGANDTLRIGVDGGVTQPVTLTHGATRSAANIVSDINSASIGVTASAIAGKVAIASNTQGSGSQITIEAANGNATIGFAVGSYVGVDNARITKLRLIPLTTNTGHIYVGCKANFDKTTGDGVLDVIIDPPANPVTLDRFFLEAHDQNVLHTQHYFIDADNTGEGVIAAIWIM